MRSGGTATVVEGEEGLPLRQPESSRAKKAVTLRALLLAGLLAPVSIIWQLLVEEGLALAGQAIFSLLSLFFNCLFFLLVLVLANQLVKKRWPGKALAPGELLVIYILLTGVTVMCGGEIIQQIVPFIAYPIRYADPETPGAQFVLSLLPTWLIVADRHSADGFWLGHTGFFTQGYWRAWLTPVLSWTLLLGIIVFGLLCLSVLVRQLWADYERLTFPIIHLPLELVTKPTFFRGTLFWVGVGVAVAIALVNGLHHLYPALPQLPTRTLAFQPNTPPWNAIGAVRFAIYPYALGLGFLISLHLAFSTVFFIAFQNLELVITRYSGWEIIPRFPFLAEQSTGALFGLILFRLVLQRRYLWGVMACALGRPTAITDAAEPISYRLAVLGLLGAMLGMTLLCMSMGISTFTAGLFVGLYFVQSLGVARLRAELGPPAHDIWGSDITTMMVNSMGTQAFPGASLTGLHLLRSFAQSTGDHPMPNQLEGLQIANRLESRGGGLFWSLLIFMTVGTALSMAIFAALEHRFGAATARGGPMIGGEPGVQWWSRIGFWNPLVSQATLGQAPIHGAAAALFGGAIFAVALSLLTVRFASWPLHPIGFVIAQSWYVVAFMWFSIFLAWLVKSIILRYGGRAGYEKALPFFYGLIIGDCLAGVAWTFIFLILHTTTYTVWA